jgi:hypothetical protein
MVPDLKSPAPEVAALAYAVVPDLHEAAAKIEILAACR